jgi:hypothetical protein
MKDTTVTATWNFYLVFCLYPYSSSFLVLLRPVWLFSVNVFLSGQEDELIKHVMVYLINKQVDTLTGVNI